MSDKNQNSIMIVSIDEQATTIAVQKGGEVIHSSHLIIGTRATDEAIAKFFREELGLSIGLRTAQAVRTEVGSASSQETKSKEMRVRGRNIKAKLPQDITVSDEQICKAVAEIVRSIVNEVRTTIEQIPEARAEIFERGILLRGEGGKLRGLDRILSQEIGLPVTVV